MTKRDLHKVISFAMRPDDYCDIHKEGPSGTAWRLIMTNDGLVMHKLSQAEIDAPRGKPVVMPEDLERDDHFLEGLACCLLNIEVPATNAEWCLGYEKGRELKEKLGKPVTLSSGPGTRLRSRSDIELEDGGCIEMPDPDGTIRRRDKDGNCEEIRHFGDEDWSEWADLFDKTDTDFKEEGEG